MTPRILLPHERLSQAQRQYRRALRAANNASTLFQAEADRVLAEARQALRAARKQVNDAHARLVRS